MVSPAVNVIRYTALFSGVVYGVVHRKTLQEQFDKHAAEKEVQLRQHWLDEAKKAWANKQKNESGLITDPEAPGFDLEALLKAYEK
ncbi:F1F0 ATP synthase subunit e, mitochondrial [Rhodotorula kratochvilovae]